mgnify:CR=1 FL=1
MGRTFVVNLDRETGEVLLDRAKKLAVNPSRLVRSLIMRYFGIEDDLSNVQPPKDRYSIDKRFVVMVYLPDDVADALYGYLETTGMDLSEFVRRLLRGRAYGEAQVALAPS